MINTNLVKELTYRALERLEAKDEIVSYSIEYSKKALYALEENENLKALNNINEALAFLPKANLINLIKALILCSQKKSVESNKIIFELEEETYPDYEFQMKWFILSCNALHQKEFTKAISYSNQIIEKFPEAIFAYGVRGLACSEINEFKPAINDLRIALNQGIEIEVFEASLAFCYMKTGRIIKSIFIYRRIISHFQFNYRVNHHIGINYFILNFRKKALFHFNKSILLMPEFGEAYK